MTALDSVIASPRLVEIDRIDLSAPAGQVWRRVRHAALAHSRVTRALFALRTLVDWADASARPPGGVRLDDLTSSPRQPGFRILVDEPPREVVAGAIGKVWRLRIPFVHVDGPEAFAAFAEPGYVKVAWAIRVSSRSAMAAAHLELRGARRRDRRRRVALFRRYFHVIGPASRFIRRSLLRALVRELRRPEPDEDQRAGWRRAAARRGAPADRSHRRGGDAGSHLAVARADGLPARRLLQHRRARQRRPPQRPRNPSGAAGPRGRRRDTGPPGRGRRLRGARARRRRARWCWADCSTSAPSSSSPFAAAAARARFWQVTWAFVLEPLDGRAPACTCARARAFPRGGDGCTRVDSRRCTPHGDRAASRISPPAPRAGCRATTGATSSTGVGGAARMALARSSRRSCGRRASHWGLDREDADRAAARRRARSRTALGLDARRRDRRAGRTRCGRGSRRSAPTAAASTATSGSRTWPAAHVRNAERVHPEWQVRAGDRTGAAPEDPAAGDCRASSSGRLFVAARGARRGSAAAGAPDVAASWLFLVEPLEAGRSRFVSRYRVAYPDTLRARLAFGPAPRRADWRRDGSADAPRGEGEGGAAGAGGLNARAPAAILRVARSTMSTVPGQNHPAEAGSGGSQRIAEEAVRALEQFKYTLDQAAIVAITDHAASSRTSTTSSARFRRYKPR